MPRNKTEQHKCLPSTAATATTMMMLMVMISVNKFQSDLIKGNGSGTIRAEARRAGGKEREKFVVG